MPTVHFPIVANRALGGGEEKEKKKKNLSRQLPTLLPFILVYPCSLHFLTAHLYLWEQDTKEIYRALCTMQAILWATWTIWKYMSCPALLKNGGGGGEFDSFYSIFILLGSGSLLLSCSSPSPCHLISIPLFFYISFTPLLSSSLPLFSFPLLPSLFSARTSPCQVLWIPQSFI